MTKFEINGSGTICWPNFELVHWSFTAFQFSWTLNSPLRPSASWIQACLPMGVVSTMLPPFWFELCMIPLQLNIEPSTGCLQISASALHTLNPPLQLKLNLPLVVCRFPLQLYIKPSTGCLQISASAIHWTYYRGVQNFVHPFEIRISKGCLQLLPDSASSKRWNLHCSSTDYYACNIWFIICLWDSHFHIAIASLVLNLRKIWWFFFIPPYSTQKNYVWDGHGIVEMWAHSPCSWFLILW